jgi:sugar lactone lactonase YvrE
MREVVPMLLLALGGCGLVGGEYLEDRTTAPAVPIAAVETVASLDHPPGNVAVSADGRVFFTFHPDGDPPIAVAELVDGKPVPWPPGGDHPAYQSVLSIRIDRQNRLWALDYARYGRGQPRLMAFDLATGRLVHRYDFPSDVAGFLSMLNDFNVDPAGEKIYIAESSPILQHPALVVYDVTHDRARRVLDRDRSVRAERYVLRTPEREMKILGLFPIRIGVDSIALDRRGEWLYFGPVSGDRMYRVATRDLDDESLSPAALAARVEDWAPKTLSDGMTIDTADTLYVTDPEHGAVVTIAPDRTLRTLVKDPTLRWPDGLSFGPDGWLYLTCSALQHVIFVSDAHVRAHAPYHVFRLKPGGTAPAGQ